MKISFKDIPYIEEYIITFIQVEEYNIPRWIEFEYEGTKLRAGVNSPPFALKEVQDIGMNYKRYIGGKVTVMKAGNRLNAILLQENPDYVDTAFDRKDAERVFNAIK